MTISLTINFQTVASVCSALDVGLQLVLLTADGTSWTAAIGNYTATASDPNVAVSNLLSSIATKTAYDAQVATAKATAVATAASAVPAQQPANPVITKT